METIKHHYTGGVLSGAVVQNTFLQDPETHEGSVVLNCLSLRTHILFTHHEIVTTNATVGKTSRNQISEIIEVKWSYSDVYEKEEKGNSPGSHKPVKAALHGRHEVASPHKKHRGFWGLRISCCGSQHDKFMFYEVSFCRLFYFPFLRPGVCFSKTSCLFFFFKSSHFFMCQVVFFFFSFCAHHLRHLLVTLA